MAWRGGHRVGADKRANPESPISPHAKVEMTPKHVGSKLLLLLLVGEKTAAATLNGSRSSRLPPRAAVPLGLGSGKAQQLAARPLDWRTTH